MVTLRTLSKGVRLINRSILLHTEKQCAFHEIVQNALFRSCAARFGQIAFLICKVLEIVTMAWISDRNRKTVPFPWKLCKTNISGHSGTFWPYRILECHCFQNRETGLKFSSRRKNSAVAMKVVQSAFLHHAQHVLAKSRFWPSKFSKSSHWPEILLKREKSALSIKIVQNALFRSCVAQRSVARSSLARENCAMKIVDFSGHAQCLGQNFWPSMFNGLNFYPKSGNSALFYKNSAKRSFQVSRSTFWPNRIFERQSSQNGETRLKFSSERENSALSMKIVQNAFFRSSARLGQIAVLTVKVLKNVTLAWNSFKEGKTVRFSLKLYKTLFSGHAEHVLAKSHFWPSKFSKLL